MRIEAYDKAEKRFYENLRLKEAKFQEERDNFNKKFEDITKGDTQKFL